jgi:hypothetical protein
MAYRLSRGLFVENGPAEQAANAAAARPATRFLAWRRLSAQRRLQAIEQALKCPANDCGDGLPLAL